MPEDGRLAHARHVAHAVQHLRGIRGGDLNARCSRGIRVGQFLQLGDRADRDQLRHVDVADAPAALRFVHVVRGDEERDALARELKEQIPQRAPRHRIDARGRLVEKDHLRRVDDGAGQRQPLLPSAGELACAPVHVGLDPGQRLHLARALCSALAGETVHARIEIDVLGDRQVLVEAELLRHVADVPPDLRRILANIHAQDAARAFGRPQQSAERLDDGGFAGSVRTQESKQLSLADLEAHVAAPR